MAEKFKRYSREDNQVLDKTIVYSYDAGGNLQSKVEYSYTNPLITPSGATNTVNYTYGDASWKDKLTNFNGKDITYDAIGNPLTYDGYTYSWEWGRRLAFMTGNGKAISYKYNDSGIRTQKTVNNITTNYRLVGDKVTYEDNGTDEIYYTYDSSGDLVSINLNGVEYYYIRNAQNDIIGLFDSDGNQVASYTYDSWGKLISIKDQNGTDITKTTTHVGYKNPYRYRGYRYDSETGLYYLQSRYYNPEWDRFINADGIIGKTGDILGHNLFAYCKNNPVNMSDPSGFYASWADFRRFDEQNYKENLPKINAINKGRVLNSVDNAVSSPSASVGISKPDGILGTAIGTKLTKSRRIKINGPYNITGYIRNPGMIAKFSAATIKSTGVLSVATLGIGVANNFINYEHSWDRTAVDLACFGAGILGGAVLAAAAPATIAGTLAVATGGLLITAGTAFLNNEIKNSEYLSTRRRGE